MEDVIPVQPTAQAVPAYGEYPEPGRRALITLGVVLTTLMTSIDGTDRQHRAAADPLVGVRLAGRNPLGADVLHSRQHSRDPGDRLA